MMKMFYVFALQNGSHEMNVAIEHLICGQCTCVDHNKLESSERDGITRSPYLSSERPVCEATVGTGHGTTHWFTIGKEYVKAVYCDPAYLTYMQSTS